MANNFIRLALQSNTLSSQRSCLPSIIKLRLILQSNSFPSHLQGPILLSVIGFSINKSVIYHIRPGTYSSEDQSVTVDAAVTVAVKVLAVQLFNTLSIQLSAPKQLAISVGNNHEPSGLYRKRTKVSYSMIQHEKSQDRICEPNLVLMSTQIKELQLVWNCQSTLTTNFSGHHKVKDSLTSLQLTTSEATVLTVEFP